MVTSWFCSWRKKTVSKRVNNQTGSDISTMSAMTLLFSAFPYGAWHHPVIEYRLCRVPVSAAALLSLSHRALSPFNLVSYHLLCPLKLSSPIKLVLQLCPPTPCCYSLGNTHC